MKVAQLLEGRQVHSREHEAVKPQVSIILPTFNRESEGLLAPCIESVLAQTFTDFEFIVIDDGSQDQTRAVLQRYAEQDARILYIRHDHNCGLPAIRTNEGILIARAPLIGFIFDDNRWKPDALETLVAALETSRADLVHGQVSLQTAGGKEQILGEIAPSFEMLQTINTIPNGGVLCRATLFAEHGLYDPHLVLRRVCDWDLWRRATMRGANFIKVDKVVGSEHGLTSPQSLGNTVSQDIKVVTAYMQDDRRLAARCEQLKPNAIPDYEFDDPEFIARYVRSYVEWGELEKLVYQPFIHAHPELEIRTLPRHNRRYDLGKQDYRFNGTYPIFHDRKRVLLVSNRTTRLVLDWQHAFGEDADAIVLIFNEPGALSLLPSELDLVILFDCCSPSLRPFLNGCQRNHVPVLSLINHGEDIPLAGAAEPKGLLEQQGHIQAFFKAPFYLPAAGQPWTLPQKTAAQSINRLVAQVFRVDAVAERSAAHLEFVPNAVPQVPGFHPEALQFCVFAEDWALLDAAHQEVLQNASAAWSSLAPLELYLASDENLPSSLKDQRDKGNIVIRITHDSLPVLIACRHQRAWFIPNSILKRYGTFYQELMKEDALRNGSVLAPLEFLEKGYPAKKTLQKQFDLSCQRHKDQSQGCRSDARYLYLQNIALGVILRSMASVLHGDSSAAAVRTAVMANSQLFGGSEMYGFLTARALSRIGFDLQVCIPRLDQYGSGTDQMELWLKKNNLPPLKKLEYGQGALAIHQFTLNQDPILDYAENLSIELEKIGAGIIFCSGFIAEPIIARRENALLYLGLFPPWGYELRRMTFSRDRIDGLVSDSRWAANLWAEWIAPPIDCVYSLIEPHYFTRHNQSLPPQPICIAVVGTMIFLKRQKEVLLAVLKLVEEGFDLKLNFYGSELEIFADYIKEMKKLAENDLLRGRVTFHGYVEDPSEINRDNHIIVSASGDESIPQGMVFNMAAGLLPVACPSGGIAELVRDGETGFLTGGFSVEDLIDTLRRALLRRAEWPQMIERGRELLTNEASEPAFVNRLLRVMVEGAQIRAAEGNDLFSSAASKNQITKTSVQSSVRSVEPPILPAGMQLVIGPDVGKISQHYFVNAAEDELAGLIFRSGTFSSAATGDVTIQLQHSNSRQILREITFDAALIQDNAWLIAKFEPVWHSRGKIFEVRVTADLDEGRLAFYSGISMGASTPYWENQARRIVQRISPFPLIVNEPTFFPHYQIPMPEEFDPIL